MLELALSIEERHRIIVTLWLADHRSQELIAGYAFREIDFLQHLTMI